jgi:transcriptional regulator with XRE-family HTH domain
MRMVADESASANGALLVFAEELRHARTARGLSQDQLSALILFSASQVGMVESARRVPSLDFARRADEALDTGGTLLRLHRLVRMAPYPEWFRQYTILESEATELRSWQPLAVDGLLQTPEYARVILSTRVGVPEDEIDQRVTARMNRQAVLTRLDPPLLWVLLDETVLRRPVGGRAVMQAQLEHLAEMSRRPNVVVQVVPTDVGAHDGSNGAFVIADFAQASSVVYLDTALEGIVIEWPQQVAAVRVSYDTLRGEAMSRSASAQFLREMAKEWT